ncbi:hypothetical protein Tco_0753058 [Tanacetum coccineum]
MITTNNKMEGKKPSRIMETVDIMDLIPFVRSVLCITQDLKLSDVRIETDIREKDKKSSKNEQNQARSGKAKVKSKPKLTKVKVKVNPEKSTVNTKADIEEY